MLGNKIYNYTLPSTEYAARVHNWRSYAEVSRNIVQARARTKQSNEHILVRTQTAPRHLSFICVLFCCCFFLASQQRWVWPFVLENTSPLQYSLSRGNIYLEDTLNHSRSVDIGTECVIGMGCEIGAKTVIRVRKAFAAC